MTQRPIGDTGFLKAAAARSYIARLSGGSFAHPVDARSTRSSVDLMLASVGAVGGAIPMEWWTPRRTEPESIVAACLPISL